jgi:hypothetical protein
MGFAVVMALLLGRQDVLSSEDTLDQWENHLLESKWTLTDKESGAPRMVLVLKYFSADHRIFELTVFNDCRREGVPWIETWTGTYKMEARRPEDKTSQAQDALKLVRLRAEQHWYPVDSAPYWWPPDGRGAAKVGPWLWERGLIHWTELISNIDWVERKEFKEFFAELIFDAPFMAQEPPIAPDSVRFFLRSDEVKHIGWWQIGVERVFSSVRKR